MKTDKLLDAARALFSVAVSMGLAEPDEQRDWLARVGAKLDPEARRRRVGGAFFGSLLLVAEPASEEGPLARACRASLAGLAADGSDS